MRCTSIRPINNTFKSLERLRTGLTWLLSSRDRNCLPIIRPVFWPGNEPAAYGGHHYEEGRCYVRLIIQLQCDLTREIVNTANTPGQGHCLVTIYM